jgi:hypothetical protein
VKAGKYRRAGKRKGDLQEGCPARPHQTLFITLWGRKVKKISSRFFDSFSGKWFKRGPLGFGFPDGRRFLVLR